jgi:transposase
VRTLPDAATPTVYRRLTTLMGEEGPGRWGAFASIGSAMVCDPSGFVMVLSYSRAVFALFTLNQTLESFLRGHVDAFEAYEGLSPKVICYAIARREDQP